MGSKCKCRSSGETWSLFAFFRTNLAALFWFLCRQFISVSGKPAKLELQYSNLDVMKALASLAVVLSVRYDLTDEILAKARNDELSCCF